MSLISDEIKKNPPESASRFFIIIPLVCFILIVAGGIFFLKPKQTPQLSNQNGNQNLAAAINTSVNRFVNSAGTVANQNTNQAIAVNTSATPNQNVNFFVQEDKAKSPESTNTPVVKKTSGNWVGIFQTADGFVKLTKEGFSKSFNLLDAQSRLSDFTTQYLQVASILGQPLFVAPRQNTQIQKAGEVVTWGIDGLGEKLLLRFSTDVIQTPVFSPDGTQMAFIGANMGQGGSNAQALSRTIWIYNLKDKSMSNILWDNQLYMITRLQWTPNGLFAISFSSIALFDPQTKKILYSSPTGTDVVISPDGTKYFDPKDDVIRTIPTGQAILIKGLRSASDALKAKLDFTLERAKAFSQDSKKLLLFERKYDLSEWHIVEFDIASQNLKQLATHLTSRQSSYFRALMYNPNDSRILLNVQQGDDDIVYELRSGSTTLNRLPHTDGSFFKGNFITWYQ